VVADATNMPGNPRSICVSSVAKNSNALCPVRPPQTAIGRPAGTLLGSAPVPVAVFAVAPKTISQTEWCRQRMAHRPRASVSWTAGASAARPRFRTHGNLSHHECFSSARKRRRRSRSAGAVQNRPPQTTIGRTAGTWLGSAPVPVAVFGVAPGARIVPIRSAPPDQRALKSFQPSLVMPPAASWDNSRSAKNGFTSSLIPAFSPRRRRNARRLFEKPATGLAERSNEKTKRPKAIPSPRGRRPG
jgi:hypothetical protein